ncbi:hypothetical protein K1719_004957 [Acacia pycnantha]|nr:hypothetical protein K1719_004957 [Acacia pycnantha]
MVSVAMVAAKFLEVGLNTIMKAATTNGMSKFVFVVYSNALALCFLHPSTFLYQRIFVTSVLRSEPWDLAGTNGCTDKSRLKTRTGIFFSALDKKYDDGGRMNLAMSKG